MTGSRGPPSDRLIISLQTALLCYFGSRRNLYVNFLASRFCTCFAAFEAVQYQISGGLLFCCTKQLLDIEKPQRINYTVSGCAFQARSQGNHNGFCSNRVITAHTSVPNLTSSRPSTPSWSKTPADSHIQYTQCCCFNIRDYRWFYRIKIRYSDSTDVSSTTTIPLRWPAKICGAQQQAQKTEQPWLPAIDSTNVTNSLQNWTSENDQECAEVEVTPQSRPR